MGRVCQSCVESVQNHDSTPSSAHNFGPKYTPSLKNRKAQVRCACRPHFRPTSGKLLVHLGPIDSHMRCPIIQSPTLRRVSRSENWMAYDLQGTWRSAVALHLGLWVWRSPLGGILFHFLNAPRNFKNRPRFSCNLFLFVIFIWLEIFENSLSYSL